MLKGFALVLLSPLLLVFIGFVLGVIALALLPPWARWIERQTRKHQAETDPLSVLTTAIVAARKVPLMNRPIFLLKLNEAWHADSGKPMAQDRVTGKPN